MLTWIEWTGSFLAGVVFGAVGLALVAILVKGKNPKKRTVAEWYFLTGWMNCLIYNLRFFVLGGL